MSDLLVISWGTHYSDGLLQHDLIGAVRVEINTGHEAGL